MSAKRGKRARAPATLEASEGPKRTGRPSDYRPEYCDQVEKLCRLGATDEHIADFFGKPVSTISNWKLAHPEFLEAIKNGKVIADMQVANSLFKKATGYVVETERVIGKGDNARVVKLNVAVEADTTACIFWLKNRAPETWRDKKELILTGHEDALEALESAVGHKANTERRVTH